MIDAGYISSYKHILAANIDKSEQIFPKSASFNRVGIAPRFVFQISNLKYEISIRIIAARSALG